MTQKISQKTDGPPVSEVVFAKKTGVATDAIVDTRNVTLAAAEDFYERAARIYYTPAGVAKMLAALGLAPDALGAAEAQGDDSPTPGADPAPDAPPASETRLWYVLRRIAINKRLLVASAEKKGGGESVRIRVRDNTTWRIDQEIHATPPAAGSCHWIARPEKKGRRRSR